MTYVTTVATRKRNTAQKRRRMMKKPTVQESYCCSKSVAGNLKSSVWRGARGRPSSIPA
jgi:hypothetical protein